MCGVLATAASIAAPTSTPSASSASMRGPSRGSVMFCDSAMPIPLRQCRQRLATLMLDEATAAPSWPVRSSQAAIDRVM